MWGSIQKMAVEDSFVSGRQLTLTNDAPRPWRPGIWQLLKQTFVCTSVGWHQFFLWSSPQTYSLLCFISYKVFKVKDEGAPLNPPLVCASSSLILLGGVGCGSHHSRPNESVEALYQDASPLWHWSIERARVCVLYLGSVHSGVIPPFPSSSSVCAMPLSLRYATVIVSTVPLFRLSAHAWQFDCLSLLHRFPPVISARCVFHPPKHKPTSLRPLPTPPLTVLFIKDIVWVRWVCVCFLETCGKFTLEDYHWSSSCCSGGILMWKSLCAWGSEMPRRAARTPPLLFFLFIHTSGLIHGTFFKSRDWDIFFVKYWSIIKAGPVKDKLLE